MRNTAVTATPQVEKVVSMAVTSRAFRPQVHFPESQSAW